MANGEPITTRFKCDISDLKKGITEANKAIKLANAEFKAASASMDDWSGTSDGLSAKLKQLNTILDSQKQKLQSYKSQQEALNKASEENGRRASELRQKLQELADQGVSKTSAEYKKYKTALDECEKEQAQNKTSAENLNITIKNQEAQVAKTKKEISGFQNSLKDVETASKNAESPLAKLTNEIEKQESELKTLENEYKNVVLQQGKNSKEAKELANEIKDLDSELNDNKSKLEKAEKATNDLTDAMDDAEDEARNFGDGFTVMKGALANLVADGFRKAIDATKEFAKSMITTAAEVKAQNAQYEQTFGDMAGKADEAIGRVAGSTGILENRLKSSATGIYSFAKASGADAPKAMSLMETSLMAASDTAAYYDMSLDEATERLQAFMKGNFANDAALGVSCTETTRNAKATELFGKKYNELSEIQKQETLLKMVTDAQKASGAFGQASRESDGWENVMGNLNQAWKDFQAQVGTPFLEALIPVIQEVTKAFQEWLQNVDWESFKKTVQDVCDKIIEGFKWVIDNKELVIGGFAAIAGIVGTIKLISFISEMAQLVKVVKSWELVTKAQTAAQWLLNAAQTASPITWVILGITALVAAFVLLWKNCDGFREFWINLWEKIKEACSVAKDWIGGVVEEIGKFFTETLPKAFSSVVDWIKENWQSILAFLINPFAGLFKYFYDNNGKFKEFVDNAIKYIKELPSKVWTWLVNTINKVTTWSSNMISKAKETALNFINKIIDYIKQLPSKVWTWLVNVVSKVSSWASNLVSKGKEAASNFINRVIDYIRQLPSKVWTYLSDVISKVSSWASNLINKGKSAASNFINSVVNYIRQLPSQIWSWLTNVVSRVGTWGSNLASKGREAAQKLLSSIVNKVQEIPSKIISIGKDIVSGLWNGINDKIQWLKNKISGFVGNVTDWIKKFFKIGSPSKLMANEVGKWLPEGIAVGIDKNAKSVLNSMKELALNTVGTAKESLSNTSYMSKNGNSGISGGVVNNFTQVINSPKQLSRLDIYRQSKNLLGYVRGGV
jgi:phage-related protein